MEWNPTVSVYATKCRQKSPLKGISLKTITTWVVLQNAFNSKGSNEGQGSLL